MAAPSHQTRSTPGQAPAKDGLSTKIALENDSDIEFWEVEVQPPGVDGGDAIEMTTMHSVTWRIFRSRQLKTLTEFTVRAFYAQDVYVSILAQINNEQTITIIHPDTDKTSFYGFMRRFEPQPNVEGQPPEANITFMPTNWDPNAGAEAGPTIGTAVGTG